MSSRFVLPILVTAFALVAGCATDPTDEGADNTQDALQITAKYLGPILSGRTRIARYETESGLSSFGFEARGGDKITLEFKSANGSGNPMGYLTDTQGGTIKENDDASPATRNSRIDYVVPAGSPLQSYRAAFKDLQLSATTLHVKLSMRGGGPTACNYYGQTYAAGDRFAAAGNECNECTCAADGTPNGRVECTHNECVCEPSKEPWRDYIAAPEQCQFTSYDCTKPGESWFDNSCGCGCERAH